MRRVKGKKKFTPKPRARTTANAPPATVHAAKGSRDDRAAAPGATPAGAGLGNIRDSIDAIDARIHGLLNERARFAQLVGISKAASGRAVDY